MLSTATSRNAPDAELTRHAPVLEAHQISKSFAGVEVLSQVDFDLRLGEVHTLIGENGAGKSTLMKILAGVHRPDSGQIRINATDVTISSPVAARRHGIALIHQEPLSFPDLSVAENVFLGHDIPRGVLGQLDRRRMHEQTRALLSSLGVALDPRKRVGGLSIADQQMVELAAALSQDARILLMDEPTAALTPREVQRLFGIVRRLRGQGNAIVFISHRLGEVLEISDRITVLRDGRLIATHPVADANAQQMIREMVGRPLSTIFERPACEPGETLLEVKHLGGTRFHDITFSVRAGEIVGLAGLVGAGRTDVAQAIFGVTPPRSGTIAIAGNAIRIRSPRDSVRHGVAYVPEDRQQHGLLLPMSVAANTSAAHLSAVSHVGWISSRREALLACRWTDRLGTRLRSVVQPVRELSGGNQQKVVLGKWLTTDPRVLILDEPTRGIDVGAKAEVHHLMAELARQGKAILMISSDLTEVLAMSDRVLVMREGRLTGTLSRSEATQERVMAAATAEHAARDDPDNFAASPAAVQPGDKSPSVFGAAPAQGPGRWVTSQLARFRELGIAVVVLLAFMLCAWLEPRFLSPESLRSILLYLPLILVVAMGQMVVIVSRNIDLSVGSILGFSAIVVGNLYVTLPDMPILAAALVGAAVGAAMGLFNGLLVALLRVPAIIATLGTLTGYRGLIFIYSEGRQVNVGQIPYSLVRLSQTSPVHLPWIGTVPWLMLFAVLVVLLTAVVLRWTRTGREVYAIGSNPVAAQLRGVPVRRILILAFTITGVLSGLAGVMFASRTGYVNPVTTGAQLELIVISAVVIGGVNVFGGSGTVSGVALGCLLLGIINVALPMLSRVGISANWQLAVYGAAILLAASLDSLIRWRTAAGEATQ